MNRERLALLRDHLAGLPDGRVRMKWLFDAGSSDWTKDGPRTYLNECGTAACIAGWSGYLFAAVGGCYSAKTAGIDLSLNEAQTDALFTPPGYWEHKRYTRSDAIAAIQSMLDSPDDDALPVWPSREGVSA